MAPEEERRVVNGLVSAVAALQAGERYGAEDRELIRKEIRDSERRLFEEVADTRQECKDFRVEVRTSWAEDRKARAERERSEVTGRRSVTVAWIVASMALLGSIAQAVASILGA